MPPGEGTSGLHQQQAQEQQQQAQAHLSQIQQAQHQQQKRDFSEEATSPQDAQSDTGKKRQRTAAGSGSSSSRGVANLTPDQLAKKRANDREAQRAIRERTKNQIENYERKIRELQAQQPYQELQHALRQKESVEAENADIKKRLAGVMALITPILGQHGIEIPTYAAQPQYMPQRPGSSSNLNSGTSSVGASPIAAPGPPQWQAPAASMAPDPRYAPLQISHAAQVQQVVKQRHEMAHNLDMGPERLGLEFLLDGAQRVNKMPNCVNSNGAHDSPTSYPHHQSHRDSARDSPVHHRSSSIGSHGGSYTAGTPQPPPSNELSGHNAPIRNGPPTCPLDSLLLDFLHERQALQADGASAPILVGPAYPSVSSLLNPARAATAHPLSKVFTDILATFPDLSTLPEKVAVLYIMFLIMRWQISPTQENYDRLPDWVAPRPSQLFTSHPAWIDHLPWPKMRDHLVRHYSPRDYLFDNFFIPFTTTLSLNWPYEPTDVLLSVKEGREGSTGPAVGGGAHDGMGDDLVINPVFERHLRRLENWSLGTNFARAFPSLEGTYRLKVEGDRRL